MKGKELFQLALGLGPWIVVGYEFSRDKGPSILSLISLLAERSRILNVRLKAVKCTIARGRHGVI